MELCLEVLFGVTTSIPEGSEELIRELEKGFLLTVEASITIKPDHGTAAASEKRT